MAESVNRTLNGVSENSPINHLAFDSPDLPFNRTMAKVQKLKKLANRLGAFDSVKPNLLVSYINARRGSSDP